MGDAICTLLILAIALLWLAFRYTKRRALLQRLDGILIRAGHRVAMNGSNPRNPGCPACYTRHISVCTRTGKAICPCGARWVITTAELETATRNQI